MTADQVHPGMRVKYVGSKRILQGKTFTVRDYNFLTQFNSVYVMEDDTRRHTTLNLGSIVPITCGAKDFLEKMNMYVSGTDDHSYYDVVKVVKMLAEMMTEQQLKRAYDQVQKV